METKIKFDDEYGWRIEWKNPMNTLLYVATFETIEELNLLIKQFKTEHLKP